MSGVAFDSVSKTYARGIRALEPLSAEFPAGEITCLMGPSGSGKSTALRLIAGLEEPSSGVIRLGGRLVNDVPPHLRGVGMAFQSPALYPHLNVFENIAFSMRARGVSDGEIRSRVQRVAEQLRIGELLRRRPSTLSGGEKQRVALGRVLAARPAVILLDEPFSNLDTILLRELRRDALALLRESNATVILVTHDPAEALAMADRVAVIDKGRLLQFAPVAEVIEQPATPEVAQLLERRAI